MNDVASQSKPWQCRTCAAQNALVDGQSSVHCWACGTARPNADWSRRLRRVAAIVVGVALHVGAGVLIWLFPPGTSMWSWALYLAMGVAGFLHIFIGGEILRRKLYAEEQEAEPVFTAAALSHLTGEPTSLSPAEMRTSGAAVVAVVLVMAAVSCVLLWAVAGP